jgi:LPS export ABC transporter protein LptC
MRRALGRLRGRTSVVTLSLGLVVAGACTSRGKQPSLAVRNALADSADQVLYHTKSVLTDAGVMKAEVYADTAYVFDDNTRVEMRVVRTIFYTATGAKNAVLTSLQGTYNTRTNNMEAHGNVVVVSEDGRRLTTPVLKYAQGRSEISSDSAFTLTDPSRQMTGIGFVSDPNMNNMRCLKACSGYAGPVSLPNGQDTAHGANAPSSGAPSSGAAPAPRVPSSGAPSGGAAAPGAGAGPARQSPGGRPTRAATPPAAARKTAAAAGAKPAAKQQCSPCVSVIK